MKLIDAFDKLMLREGTTLSLDPNDPGNWSNNKLVGSKYGIAAASHPGLDIANLTATDAMAIYGKEYWGPIQGDSLPDSIAYEVFDEAVNMGVHGAVSVLQRAVGVMPDGALGPATLAAVNHADQSKLGMLLNAARLEFYTCLAAWPSEGKGWVRRVAMNLRSL